MDNLNFRHLYYFWVIAREGSIVRAAEHLDLTPQTLSGQLATFESALGGALFRRANRSLQLTDFGRTVLGYADEMFQTAQALSDVISQPPGERPLSLAIGIAASIHKLIAYHLTEPVLTLKREVRLNARTGDPDELLKRLAQRELDLVLTDRQPDSARPGGFEPTGWHPLRCRFLAHRRWLRLFDRSSPQAWTASRFWRPLLRRLM